MLLFGSVVSPPPKYPGNVPKICLLLSTKLTAALTPSALTGNHFK